MSDAARARDEAAAGVIAAVPAERRPLARRTLWTAALLLAVHAFLIVLDARAMGLTVDESSYFNSTRIIFRHGWVHEATRFQGPLGLYANQLFTGDVPPGELDLAARRDLVFRGRLGTLPFALLSAVIVFAWARRLFGDAGGLLALLLHALHPVVLGYSSLMLVDAQHAAMVLLTLYLVWRYLETRSARLVPWIGVALGLALATKYLAVLLALVVAATVAGAAARFARDGWVARGQRVAWALLQVVVCAFVTLHAAYVFRAGLAGTDPERYQSAVVREVLEVPLVGHAAGLLPAPFLQGVDYQLTQSEREWKPFLNGAFAPKQPATYAVAILCKTPEVTLLCLALALVLHAPRLLRRGAQSSWRTAAVATLPFAAVLFAFLSLSRMQPGMRYAVPLLPLLFLGAGALAWRPDRGLPGVRAFACLALLAAVHAVELTRSWPDWISYYNRASGGQRLAFRRFRDTNNDFGQYRADGPARLRARHGELEVLDAHSGARFGRLVVDNDALSFDTQAPGGLVLTWLLWMEPLDHLGASWWLFEVTPEAFEREVASTGDARSRRDLALAYLGAGRRADAERHIKELADELAAPLRALIAAEDAARAQPTRATLERLIEAWTELDRPDRAAALAEEHAALLDGSDAAALARVEALEERRDFAGAARALEREWTDPEFHVRVRQILDLRLAGEHEEAGRVFAEIERRRGDQPLSPALQRLQRQVDLRLEFLRLLR